MANGTPEFMQWRQETDPRFSPSSSGSSGSSAASLSPQLPTEFALSPKSRRFLSLKTYLAKLPEWSNPPRMKSLYSAFTKLKETNKFGYEANIKWWRGVLLGAARNGLLSMCPPHSTLPNYLTGTTTTPTANATATDEPAETPLYEATGSATGILELDLDYVASRFERNRMRPAALPTVMEEMTALGEIVPRSEFLPWAGVSWSGWLLHKTVKAPLLWGLEQLGLSNSSPTPSSSSPQLVSTRFGSPGSSGPNGGRGRGNTGGLLSVDNGIGLGLSSAAPVMSTAPETYIILPFVQEAAARIVKLQEESSLHPSDNVMTFQDFRQKFSRTALLPIRGAPSSVDTTANGLQLILTDRDLEIVLRYMQYVMKVLVTGKLDIHSSNNQVQDYEMIVRFATKNRLQKEKARQEITKADRGIIELRQTCKTLEIQVEDVEKRIAEMTEKARACVKKNQRRQAAYALRTRKHLEDVLQKRTQSLNMLSTILFRIQASETDTQILQSYKLGANTLASIMATKGADGKEVLSLNEVEKTMDQIADAFADQQEVDDAISAGANTGEVSDEELMAELDALMGSTPKSDQQSFEDTTRAEADMGRMSDEEAIAELERVLEESEKILAGSPPIPIPGKVTPPTPPTMTTLASSSAEPINSPGKLRAQETQDEDEEMAELEQTLAHAGKITAVPIPQRRKATPPPSLLSSSAESISSLGKRSADTEDEEEGAVKKARVKKTPMLA